MEVETQKNECGEKFDFHTEDFVIIFMSMTVPLDY
jgi:hypothetical protein